MLLSIVKTITQKFFAQRRFAPQRTPRNTLQLLPALRKSMLLPLPPKPTGTHKPSLFKCIPLPPTPKYPCIVIFYYHLIICRTDSYLNHESLYISMLSILSIKLLILTIILLVNILNDNNLNNYRINVLFDIFTVF